MKKYINVLVKSRLFRSVEPENFLSMLDCLSAKTQSYSKGEFIFLCGDSISSIGIILSGAVLISKEDSEGNRLILGEFYESEMFGEAIVCSKISHSPVSAQASSDSKILFISFHKLVSTCATSCQFHGKLISNLLEIISTKNLHLTNRIDILTKKTLREKLIAYFEFQSEKHNSNTFTIEFSRDELADYIFANRSALSRELSQMQQEKLIQYKGNSFTIL